MTRGRLIILVFSALAVLVSGIGVVYSKYSSRKYFVELQSLRAEREAIEVEWGRLQLEQSALAAHSRVERIARKRLDMRIPAAGELMVVTP